MKRQRNLVLNQPLLAGLYDQALDISLLFPDLYLDPRILTYKKLSTATRLDEWVEANFQENRNILLIGDPGIGKTTAMIKLYLDHVDKYLKGQTDVVPLFLKARAYSVNSLTSPEILLRVIVRGITPKRSLDRRLIERCDFLFFIDGLDEYSEMPTTRELRMIFESDLFKHWFILTAREDFFTKYISGIDVLEVCLYETIVLQKWRFEAEASIFIQNCFRKLNDREGQTRLVRILDENRQLRDLLTTPLLVTMLLFIWRYGRKDEVQRIRAINDLYDVFLDKWIQREHSRGTARIDHETTIKMLKDIAFKIYVSRGASPLKELLKGVSQYSSYKLTDLMADTGLLSLFSVSERTWRGTQAFYVEKFIHETLMEYLVSELVLDSILYNNPKPEDVLQTMFIYEVNEFLRNRFDQMSLSMKGKVVDRLVEIYKNNLLPSDRELLDALVAQKRPPPRIRRKPWEEDKDKVTTRMIVRDQVMYYLGQIQSEKAKEFLSICYYLEKTLWIVRIIALSSIIQGNPEIEKDYLDRMLSDREVDSINRGFCLVYHGDIDREAGDYEDDDKSSWTKTRNAFFARLAESTEREQRLRWWRLLTIRRFLETRKEFNTVSLAEKALLEQADKNIDSLPANKQEKIREELKTLKKLINSSKTA